MTEETKKIVLPAHLLRRLEAFRIVKGDEHTYLVRDKVLGQTHDFEPWQYFILEVLPGCETMEKLQTAFQDRFDRTLTPKDLDTFLGSVADRKLFDEAAVEHPLLAPYARRTYEVEDGKAKVKSFAATAAAAPEPATPTPDPARGKEGDLPPGVQDALGLDWRSSKITIKLGKPKALVKALKPLAKPLYYMVYALPLLLATALLLWYEYSSLLASDLLSLHASVNLVEHLIFVFLTVHVVTTLTEAVIADGYGLAIDQYGIAFTFGFMPRWVLMISGAERLTRTQTMWLHGAPLIARGVMFSLGAILWYNTRDSHADLAQVGLLFFFSCGVGLTVESGNPLVKANGYYLLSAYLNEAHLRARAYTALMNKLRGEVYRASDNTLLAMYALLSTTYIIFITLVAGFMLWKYVFGDLVLGGSAILIVVCFIGYMFWLNYSGLKKFGETYERQLQFDRWRSRTLPAGAVEGEVKTKGFGYWKLALLVCFILILFLPYPYAPSGSFTIYPYQKQVISTDTPGLIDKVYFEGGEAVKKGTVLAQLAHDDYIAQIKILTAKIEEQKAIVDNLKTLPKPEQVKLAEEMLAVQRSHEAYSREKEPRIEKLYRVGAVSFEEWDTARKDHEVDVQQVLQKEAELALVKVPVTADEIAAAEARLVSLQEERAGYEAKVDRTVIRMPFDGNILTLHLQDRINSYLQAGLPFASLENTGIVTAQIDIAESELQFVKLGATVRVRPVSYFDADDFIGKVTVIDRNVTVKPTGNFVAVIATIDNHDGVLKTNMSGEAKIDGVTMPVWKAFTLAIVRFVVVNVWSWIP